MKRVRRFRLGLLFLASAVPLAAHPGHGPASFATGFAHPFTGWDHLLAMLAVGLWAAQLGGRSTWLLPSAFVGGLLTGAGLALGGVVPVGVEWGIIASVVILGVAVAAAARPPLELGVALTAAAGVFHGIAHGAEMPGTLSGVDFFVGMAAATALLHALGVTAGTFAMRRHGRFVRFAGVAVCAAGFLLLSR